MIVAAEFPEYGFRVEAEAVVEKATRDYPGSVEFTDHRVFVLVARFDGPFPQLASEELRDMILDQFESEISEALTDSYGDID